MGSITFLLGSTSSVLAPNAITTEYVIIGQNSVKAYQMPSLVHKTQVLSSLTGEVDKLPINSNTLGKLAFCESSDNPLAVNPNDHGSPSYGLFQYKWNTWKWKMAQYGLAPNADDADLMNLIYDRNTQTKLTILILREPNGWRNWYNCLKNHDER